MKALLQWGLVVAAVGCLGYQAPRLVRFADASRIWPGETRWPYVGLAAALGLGAVAPYAELHRELLLVGRLRIPVPAVQGITFARNSTTSTVPVVGGAGGLAYAITRFRRQRGSRAGGMGGAGGSSAHRPVATGSRRRGTRGGGTVVRGGCRVRGRRDRDRRPDRSAAGDPPARAAAGPAPRAPAGRLPFPHPCTQCRSAWADNVDAAVRRGAARTALLRPSPARWLMLLGMAAGTWALKVAGLAASVAAVLPTLPWAGVIIGFLLVQVSIALQVLPGGAGLAEVGLLGSLDAAGVDVGAVERAGSSRSMEDGYWLLKAASKDAEGSFHSSERMNPTAWAAPCSRSMPASSHSTEMGPV
jgi:uncharacterized membrane protein YbhN (UPF0104 family)